MATATSGARALDLVRGRPFDVAILDLRLPDVEGTVLLGQLKELQPHLENIILTGFPSADTSAESPRLGAFAYLVKPVHPEVLVDTVESALAKRRLAEANRRSLQELSTLYALASAVSGSLDQEEILTQGLRQVIGLLGGGAGAAYLLTPLPASLIPVARQGLSAVRARSLASLGQTEGPVQEALHDGRSRLVPAGSRPPAAGVPSTHQLAVIPLSARDRMHGLLLVTSPAPGKVGAELLSAVGGQIGVALENARLYQDLSEERDRILEVEEEVRKKLARDLHAGPAQLLAAVLMSSRLARALFDEDPNQARQELEDLERVSQKALGQVREMLFELRPIVLETHGLQAALAGVARRMEENEGLEVKLEIQAPKDRLPRPVESLVFSIIQEALANIRKHAQASAVRLRFKLDRAALVAEVEDNGVGFDVEEVERTYAHRRSLGLLDMRERAQALGGELEIRSRRGEGTAVVLTARLEEPASVGGGTPPPNPPPRPGGPDSVPPHPPARPGAKPQDLGPTRSTQTV